MNTRIFFIIIAVCCLYFITPLLEASKPAAKTPGEVFRAGVKAYAAEEFALALRQFVTLEESGVETADIYYNIGNCWFRLGQNGRAILYYKKALLLDPLHEPALKSLKYVLTLTREKQTEQDRDVDNLLNSTVTRLYHGLSLNALAIVAVILFMAIIGIINLMFFRYRNSDRAVPIFILSVLIVLLLVTLTLGFTKWRSFHAESEAVIISPTVAGFSGPGEDLTRVFTVHDGLVVHILTHKPDWSEIRVSVTDEDEKKRDIVGWIPTESLEVIKPFGTKSLNKNDHFCDETAKPVHEGAGVAFNVSYTLQRNEMYRILAEKDGWYQIALINGDKGWIQATQAGSPAGRSLLPGTETAQADSAGLQGKTIGQ